MSVERYIESQKKQGDLDSAGHFTVDLKAAAFKMSRYRLPSENHLLLKLVQLAVLMGAAEVDIRVGMRETTLSFLGPGKQLPNFQDSVHALSDPLSAGDGVGEFVSSLLLCLVSSRSRDFVWRVFQAETSQTLSLDATGQVVFHGRALPEGEARHEIKLGYRVGWRLWEGAKRRTEALGLLKDSTRFCGLRITANQRKYELSQVAVLNDHVSEFGGSQFNAATGVMQNTRGPAVASSVLFSLCSDQRSGVRLKTPPRAAYRNKRGFVVWDQGSGPRAALSGAGLKPDGTEVPAWMLHFVQGDRDCELSEVEDAPLCRAIIILNIHGPGNNEGPRVTVVRHGVTVLETTETVDGFEDLMGCSLLFVDEELDTDISGLRIVKNEVYYRKLRGFAGLVERGHRYYQQASELLTIV